MHIVGNWEQDILAVVLLADLIKMANMIITLKIMPKDPNVDLKDIEEKAKKEISEFGGEVGKVEVEPVAFGLNALKLFFVLDESKGNIDSLEVKIKKIEGVGNVEVADMRRTVG